jgi:prepilin-type N-terminal cleavage/methylation domain-containing protein
MTLKHHFFKIQNGFSLIELAIVLFIVALLLGGLLVPLTAQIDQQRTKETQKSLSDLKDTLIGFAIVNGRLPCPATATSNGQESFCTNSGLGACGPVLTTYQSHGRCSNPYDGLVPAAVLGITPVSPQGLLLDGWNNPVHYAVSSATVGTQTNAFTVINGMKTATINSLSTAVPLLVVCSDAAGAISTTSCGAAPTVTLTNNAPALVFSLGKNGNAGTLGQDEKANTTVADQVFVSHEQSSGGAGNEDFDDMVAWLSTGILVSRMVSAGQLP